MKKLFVLISALMFADGLCGQHASQNVVTTDISNFWTAYDRITSTQDSILQYTYLDSLYFRNGTEGLAGIRAARNYTPQDYINSINNFPAFWSSIRNNTLAVDANKADLENGIEANLPTVVGLKPFENNSLDVSPDVKEITVVFSRPLNGRNTGVDYGDLGEEAFPKGPMGGRYWSEDFTSWTLPVELEPNKTYQIYISNNFRTADGLPLKPFLIEFKTSGE